MLASRKFLRDTRKARVRGLDESRLRLAELLGRLADDLQELDRTHTRFGGKN
jgi:hypothetical protein